LDHFCALYWQDLVLEDLEERLAQNLIFLLVADEFYHFGKKNVVFLGNF
jgi:hypothetical protein